APGQPCPTEPAGYGEGQLELALAADLPDARTGGALPGTQPPLRSGKLNTMKQPAMRTGRWRASMLALLLLAGSGCAMTRLQPPQLQVVEVGLVGAGVLSQQLRVRMRVHNPNDAELPVRGISYEVQLSGETFASGESERDFVVPAVGETEFSLDVTTNAAGALLSLLGNRGTGNPV